MSDNSSKKENTLGLLSIAIMQAGSMAYIHKFVRLPEDADFFYLLKAALWLHAPIYLALAIVTFAWWRIKLKTTEEKNLDFAFYKGLHNLYKPTFLIWTVLMMLLLVKKII